MQKIRSILKIGSSGAALCDPYGSEAGISLELMLGTGGVLEFELRSEVVEDSAVLPDFPMEDISAAGYYFALDARCANSNDPPLLIFSGVTLAKDRDGHPVMSVPVVNNSVTGIAAALKDRNSAEFFAELGGFDSSGNAVFAWQFPVTIRSRVYLGGGSETGVSDPAYYTASQVNALITALETRISELPASAGNITLADAGNCFEADNVENALQELAGRIGTAANLLEEI